MYANICPCQHNPSSNNQPADQPIEKMSYANCCQPYHTGNAIPQTAEALMRSRYAAYVLQNIDYIVATTVPAQQPLLDRQAVAEWSEQTDWAGLEIMKHIPKLGKRHARVEFKAYFDTPDGRQAHHELSAFVKITDKLKNTEKWYFLDPTISMQVTQKQPCICGSGEKFKRCCGAYL